MTDQLPALEAVSSSVLIASNLNAIHAAHRAFIDCESSEKLRRALKDPISSIGQRCSNADIVYYKRNESERWMGPGTVIGSEAKQVIVKHGGFCVKVHPCRLMHYSSQNLLPTSEYNSAPEDESNFVEKNQEN